MMRRGTRVIWRKLNCLNPNLQRMQLTSIGMTPETDARLALSVLVRRRNPRDEERCPIRVLKKMSAAPRGALPYTRFSREEFGGTFLDLMPYLDPKGEGDSSLAANQ